MQITFSGNREIEDSEKESLSGGRLTRIQLTLEMDRQSGVSASSSPWFVGQRVTSLVELLGYECHDSQTESES